jgi:serine phosphatase RsbU (regulator of sigma subunit)/pSer/pThr/pTyr-binding forkhead associated (FHA) protein
MAVLIAIKGPKAGQRYPLDGAGTLIGRQPDVAVYLDSLSVSRHHARIVCEDGAWFIEDNGSSNGTYVNNGRIAGRVPLTEKDELRIGPHIFQLLVDRPSRPPSTTEPIIRASIDATASNATLLSQNAAYKLQVVLAIAQDLGRALELDPVLGRLLDHLLHLFPQADRGLAVLCEGERLVVRAQRTRREGHHADFPYSRTVVRRALEGGVGLLSEDVGRDRQLELSATLVSLNLRSFLCVPLIGWEGRRLGVLQLDCLRQGVAFKPEDLELLTAVCLQASVVVENAALHAEQLREARLKQELLMARDIQQAFLPAEFAPLGEESPELFAQVRPAREMSGDLYDFFALPDGRMAFFVGDVSGKGMPAALFMIAVRTLIRHLAPAAPGPAALLRQLNAALCANNPTNLYVTLVHGVYDPRDGRTTIAAGGHPTPLLRRSDGRVEPLPTPPSLMIGCAPVEPVYTETTLNLQPGEMLILYTDGYTEAFAPDRRMFGVEGLCEALGGAREQLPLRQCAEETAAAVARFTGVGDLQDDQTLLLLRRR